MKKIIITIMIAIIGSSAGLYLDKYDLNNKFKEMRSGFYKTLQVFFSQDKTINKTNNNQFILEKVEDAEIVKDKIKPVSTLPAVSEYCYDYIQFGNPSFGAIIPLAKSNLFLCRDGYISAYNYITKNPTWVAYRLEGSSINISHKRQDYFAEDSDVPFVYRATLKDYKKSGYDRGHLASYASMDFSSVSAKQSFLLTNMTPQRAGLNRQGWERLEHYERIWANIFSVVYVYTGPIYKKKTIHKTIGINKVYVPDYFFKIVYDPTKNRAIAFVMPNAPVNKQDVAKYRVSIKDIQERTGLKFLVNIPNRDEILDNVSKMWRVVYR